MGQFSGDPSVTHDVTTIRVGTPDYMVPEYRKKGFVSEKTDAFALGIVILELLVSEGYDIQDAEAGRQEARVACREARALVDDHMGEAESFSAAVEQLSTKCDGSSWASSDAAKQAAETLLQVAIRCVKGSVSRCTPEEVLPQLEATGADAIRSSAGS